MRKLLVLTGQSNLDGSDRMVQLSVRMLTLIGGYPESQTHPSAKFFFSWGYFKNVVHSTRPRTFPHFKRRITEEINIISPETPDNGKLQKSTYYCCVFSEMDNMI